MSDLRRFAVAVSVAAAFLLVGGTAAMAGDLYPIPSPTTTTSTTAVGDQELVLTPRGLPAGGPAVLAESQQAPEGRLPVTGGDLAALLAIGLATLAAGSVIIRRAR